jgi:hypothetical protein
MTTKNSRQNKLYVFCRRNCTEIFRILIIILLIYFLSKHKSLIIVLIFEILDLIKNILRPALPYMPLDIVFVFGVAASYYYNLYIGVLIFILGIVNRVIFICLEPRHVTKAIRHIPLFIITSLYSSNSFFTVAALMLTLNYLLKYGFNIARGDFRFDKFHYNIANYLSSLVFFYLIDIVYFYLPFLC